MSDTWSLSWDQLAVTIIQDEYCFYLNQKYEHTKFILNANRSIYCLNM